MNDTFCADKNAQAIANWLMSSLSSTLPGPEILVAVLNALFDVYGDEERAYDVVFVSQHYLDVLASIVAKVRTEVSAVMGPLIHYDQADVDPTRHAKSIVASFLS